MYETESEKLDKEDLEFWKNEAIDLKRQNSFLLLKLARYEIAIKEYKHAREFLQLSGDDPLDYGVFEVN